MVSQKKIFAPENALAAGRISEPRAGYDQVAAVYDKWHWQSFWEKNETPEIVRILDSMPRARILDAGTGTGRYFELMRSRGHDVYGFDISRNMLAEASKRLDTSEDMEPFLRFGDILQIPFGDRLFDCAICCRVLSHVGAVRSALAELHRVLRKGGLALITDVDGRHGYSSTRIPVGNADVRIRVHKHTLEDIERAAKEVGFVIVQKKLIYAKDLEWRPRESDFPSIDWNNRSPISYRIVVQRSV